MKIFWAILFSVCLIVGIEFGLRHWTKPSIPSKKITLLLPEQTKKEPALDIKKVSSTDELFNLLEQQNSIDVKPIYVENFPADFAQNKNLSLFVYVLMPYLLDNNEKLLKEKERFLPIADKVLQNAQLTPEEREFYDFLIDKYAIVEIGPSSEVNALIRQLGQISPALAIAQALEFSNEGKDHWADNSFFGVHHWAKDENGQDVYIPKTYPTVKDAVDDYVLYMNKMVGLYGWRELRTVYQDSQYPRQGKIFARYMESWRLEDKEYTKKLADLFDKYQLQQFDFSTLTK